MTPIIIISYAVSLLVLLFLFAVKTIHDKRQIERLRQQIQDLKTDKVKNNDCSDDNDYWHQMLEHQYELFINTPTYRDLRLLYDLRPDQVVNEQTRKELVSQVLAAYYEAIYPLLESSDYQHNDLFICLMYFMGFRTRQIAACLGVTVEAIRKRKSRLRQRLEISGDFAFLLP